MRPRFYQFDGRAITWNLKAGSNSINHACRGVAEKTREPVGDVVLFLRHPLERLYSAYRFFRRFRSREVPKTYEACVDYALETDNLHFIPQFERFRGMRLDVYRFEQINEIWPRLFPVWLPRENQSAYAPVTDYRKQDLLDHYAEDLDIWESHGHSRVA